MSKHSRASAYGGEGWSPRTTTLRQEIGSVWSSCGVTSEWKQLKSVLLHKPGTEIDLIAEPDAVQMLSIPNADAAREQHDAIANGYRKAGVTVFYIDVQTKLPPNMMFVADLLFMTAEGVILSRPASTVRAGEERIVAARLAQLGIPILASIRGSGTFEGADVLWIDPETVVVGIGLRTNKEGARQVTNHMTEMGVSVIHTNLPIGSMHLMGLLRFLDTDLAIGQIDRTPKNVVEELESHGFDVALIPYDNEVRRMSMNFVTIGPKHILMPENCPLSQEFYENLGIDCQLVEIGELAKAAGGIGCLTGILEREK